MMTSDMAWVGLVVLGVCIHMIYVMALVGKARGEYDVQAPATTGHEMFDRHNRVHLNSVEQSVIFFPLLLVCAFAGAPLIAAVLGALYLLGRILYARGYVKDPKSRGTGMMIGFFAQIALLLVAAFYLIRSLL